jgi:hypothetical protein
MYRSVNAHRVIADSHELREVRPSHRQQLYFDRRRAMVPLVAHTSRSDPEAVPPARWGMALGAVNHEE